MQDGFAEISQDMELTDLMFDIAKNCFNCAGIQVRPIGRDPNQLEFAGLQMSLKVLEERYDVGLIWIMFKHLVSQALKSVIVDNGQNTKWSVVKLIGRNVAREVLQRPIQMRCFDSSQ